MAGSRSSTQGRAVRSGYRCRVFFRHTKVTTPASSFSRAFAVVGVWRSTADRHRMGALARRPALVAVCALLLLCPAPAEGACALPSPKRRSDPPVGTPPLPARTTTDAPDPTSPRPGHAGQIVTKTLSRSIKSAWRERRVAAASGEPPATWFQRTVDWIDGRDGASLATKKRLSGRGEGAFDPFAAEEAQTASREETASWEETVATGGEATTALSPEETVASPAAAADRRRRRRPSPNPTTRRLRGENRRRLAERRRRRSFLFERSSEESSRRAKARPARGRAANPISCSPWAAARRRETRRTPRPPRASRRDERRFRRQREKRSKPIGDAVSDLTQRDAAARAARAEAGGEGRLRAGKTTGGTTSASARAHQHHRLYPETSTPPAPGGAPRTALAGVAGGLGVAGGVGIELAARDAKGNVIDGSLKRKWLVAFCTPCRRRATCSPATALLGAEAPLRDFGSAGGLHARERDGFCGARFAGTVEGYPTVALVAGGRIVRYSAVDRSASPAPSPRAAAAAIDATRRIG